MSRLRAMTRADRLAEIMGRVWATEDLDRSFLLDLLREARAALAGMTERGKDAGGCPGEDEHGPHTDTIHVAPYHCEPEPCSICRLLADLAPLEER